MNTLVARRAFLGTAAVAGAGLVGRPLLAVPSSDHITAAIDPVAGELLAQLQLAVPGIGRAHAGASARQAVGVLRIAAAHFGRQGLDRAFGQHLRAQIRLEGREAMLRQPVDSDRLAAELARFGVETPPRPRAIDPVEREQALERLLASGAVRHLKEGTDTLERLAGRLDRVPGGLVAVRYQDQQASGCPDLTLPGAGLELLMMGMCFWNPLACGIFSGMYAGLLIGLAITDCLESI